MSDLKKRLFWLGASLPDGHIEKSDLVAAVRKAEAEQEEKFAQKGLGRVEGRGDGDQPGVLRPEPRPLDFESVAGTSAEEKQIIDLHLLNEKQLQEKIEENGHDVPPNSSKHYLVALCRKALKDPKAPKPKKKVEEGEESDFAMAEYRRPTIGDRVQVRDTMVMKRYLPEAIGKVFRIIKDDGGAFPYRLAGVGEQRHWFGEEDVCWPTKVQTKVFIPGRSKKEKNPDQPAKVMINHNRYGCTQGEVRDVIGETADKKSWVLQGGRQVPKSHEHSGWSRIQPATPDAPPPPPPGAPPAAVTLSEAEMFAQMEEMQAQMDAEMAEAAALDQSVQSVPQPTQPPPPEPVKPSSNGAAPNAEVSAEAVSEAQVTKDSKDSKDSKSAGQEARRKRKEAMEAKAKAAAEAADRRKARRKAAAEKAAVDVSDDEVRAVESAPDPISID